MNKKKIIGIAAAAVVLIAIVVVLILVLKPKKEYRVVKVNDYNGTVAVDRTTKKEKMDVFQGMNLITGDIVAIGDDSSLELLMDTDKHMMAEANTVFSLEASGSADSGKIAIAILNGSSLFEIENKLNEDSTFEVTTPNAVFSVRGTQFKVTYDKDDNETRLEVTDGVVAITYANDMPEEEIPAGKGKVITEADAYDITVDTQGSGNGSSSGAFGTGDFDVELTFGDGSSGEHTWEYTSGITNEDQLLAGYNEIIKNMAVFLKENTTTGNEYITFDYMYFDYDGDDQKEVILYPAFHNADGDYMRDVVFLDYSAGEQRIGVRATSTNEANDYSFYAEYNGKLARYSWPKNTINESYLYVVEAGDNLMYVLEKAYDYLVVDMEAEGLHPLPLYGDWELLFREG